MIVLFDSSLPRLALFHDFERWVDFVKLAERNHDHLVTMLSAAYDQGVRDAADNLITPDHITETYRLRSGGDIA